MRCHCGEHPSKILIDADCHQITLIEDPNVNKRLQTLLPILEAVVQSARPLLIVAEDIEGENGRLKRMLADAMLDNAALNPSPSASESVSLANFSIVGEVARLSPGRKPPGSNRRLPRPL
jgi:hypothetical protein